MNSPGVLVVSGIGALGEVLLAELSDADGLPASVSWNWEFQSATVTTWQAIAGANGSTFTVTALVGWAMTPSPEVQELTPFCLMQPWMPCGTGTC